MPEHFPYLGPDDEFRFPDPLRAPTQAPLARGGNLSPGMLLSAYRQGIFPWFSHPEPILWWSPDPRFVLTPDRLHVGKTIKKVLKRNQFQFSADTQFESVIRACSESPRPGQDGTWIVEDMIQAYINLHMLGYAHSFEVWEQGDLVGGFYGVGLGKVFCGESMFSRTPNASRAGFVNAVPWLVSQGVDLIDSQVHTDYLESLGAEFIPREKYLNTLRSGLVSDALGGSWTKNFAAQLAHGSTS